jgi:hypothetical protein
MPSSELKLAFEKAGFINVTVLDFKIPIGPWAKNPKLKDIGMWQRVVLLDGLEAFSLAIFTRFLKWSKPDLLDLLAEVRREVSNTSYHWYWPL